MSWSNEYSTGSTGGNNESWEYYESQPSESNSYFSYENSNEMSRSGSKAGGDSSS